ncbi:hypothetical protein GpSGHVEth165 [Glossina pallidipes salivary gland hypertrophy virus]|uniref:Uncharacterized protein n=1 Tax=Glossina hytrovirus (isolate Glossina pallidipes/Ethiopia/Seibersdorf/-) TaxID=379529 RepID=A0A0Y0G7M8_GHVS|nr:hypothetical protein GpSGHVEth165 [Glossina pallidipes salivary gland hypertrophy virus]
MELVFHINHLVENIVSYLLNDIESLFAAYHTSTQLQAAVIWTSNKIKFTDKHEYSFAEIFFRQKFGISINPSTNNMLQITIGQNHLEHLKEWQFTAFDVNTKISLTFLDNNCDWKQLAYLKEHVYSISFFNLVDNIPNPIDIFGKIKILKLLQVTNINKICIKKLVHTLEQYVEKSFNIFLITDNVKCAQIAAYSPNVMSMTLCDKYFNINILNREEYAREHAILKLLKASKYKTVYNTPTIGNTVFKAPPVVAIIKNFYKFKNFIFSGTFILRKLGAKNNEYHFYEQHFPNIIRSHMQSYTPTFKNPIINEKYFCEHYETLCLYSIR